MELTGFAFHLARLGENQTPTCHHKVVLQVECHLPTALRTRHKLIIATIFDLVENTALITVGTEFRTAVLNVLQLKRCSNQKEIQWIEPIAFCIYILFPILETVVFNSFPYFLNNMQFIPLVTGLFPDK